MSQAVYCKRHSEVETSVSCGRCGDPICPKCMIHAPVGVRCPDCGKSRPAPTFDVSTPFLLRGIGAGLAVALGGGLAVSFIALLVQISFLMAALIAALCYAIGESISLATNRKRGTRLRAVAVVCIVFSFILITAITQGLTFPPTQGLTFPPFVLLATAAGFFIAITRL